MPIQGNATSQEAQDTIDYTLLAGQATDTTGAVFDISGVSGPKEVEIVNTTAGTCTVQIQGSFDGVHWYGFGYHEIDGQTTTTRKVVPISIAANGTGVYLLEDNYKLVRAVQNSSSGSPSITATFHGYPTT
jgi:hypothetical protein